MAAERPWLVEEGEDGGIYARESSVCIRPRKTERGYTMGGPIADAQNPKTAAEIARRCHLFAPLEEAVRLGVVAREAQARYFQDRSRENLIASKRAEAAFDAAAAAVLALAVEGEG